MQKRHSLNDRPAINMLAGVSVAPAQKGGSSTKNADLVEWGGGSRIRTGDPMLAKHVLYQLSYTPKRKKPVWWAGLVGTGRVELPTSTLSVWRSNQLS